MPFHPVVQIISFLILAAFISLGSGPAFLAALSVVLFVYLQANAAGRAAVKQPLWRMRWLFLSIGVIYFLVTPSDTLADEGLWHWLPAANGVLEGLRRVAGLMGIAALAFWLINSTPRAELVGAIHQLTGWLGFMGVSRERLTVRLLLVLEAVPAMQTSLTSRISEIQLQGRYPEALGEAVSALMASVLEDVRTLPLKPVRLKETGWPPAAQWVLPLGLLSVLIGIQVGL